MFDVGRCTPLLSTNLVTAASPVEDKTGSLRVGREELPPRSLRGDGGDYAAVTDLRPGSGCAFLGVSFRHQWVHFIYATMEVSGAAADVLLQRPWLPVSINDCQLLAKIWFGDSAYHVLLSDMFCVWEERMDSAAIQRRSQELNKRLRAPVKAFFSHLREVVQPCLSGSAERADGEAKISLTRQEDGNIGMKLKSELAGLPFYWEFRCTTAPVPLVCLQLVRPLLAMSRLLQRQGEQLGALLLRKDAEIQDYRENGATLSRERLQTDVFEEQVYSEDFMAKALPLVCSGEQDTLGFDDHLQRLYASVVAHASRRGPKKRKLSEEPPAQEGRPVAEEPDPTQTLGAGSVCNETAERDNGQRDEDGATPGARDPVQKSHSSAPVTSNPTERPSSKPKKKKVGLFR